MDALPYRMNISAPSDEDMVDNSFETEAFMDCGETFWQDDEALDIDSIFYIASQRPAIPCRTNNGRQGDRDIWAEMIQNERMANIVSALDDIGLREFDIDDSDDGDVETQMIIEQSLRENLDIVAELAAQPTLPPYQPSEDLPTSQRCQAVQAPIASTMPLNTLPEQVESPAVVATTEQDMPPTYNSDSESEWELVSQGTTRSAMEDEGVIVPSSPPPAYAEDSGSDSDEYFELVRPNSP